MLFNFSDFQLTSLRGKLNFVHSYKSNSSAFEINEAASIKISVPRYLGINEAWIDIYSEDIVNNIYSSPLYWEDVTLGNDVFSSSLDLSKLGVGLCFFRITLISQFDTFYCYPCCDEVRFSKINDNIPHFQLSITDFKYNKPLGKYGGIIYHIFVDRFAKSGAIQPKVGTVVIDDWSKEIPEYPEYPGAPFKNNTFYGGNLLGIIDKLNYLASLGVNTVYLSPIFSSPSNHKYDTADYMSVDSMFGSDEALKKLIVEAGKLGIGIILDGVFNHTGDDSIYFNKYSTYSTIGAYQSEDSPFYKWYTFKSYPDDYASWWGISILPKINVDIPCCRDYFVGRHGVIDKYASMGIDGFRLDVADELSDSFIRAIKEKLNEKNSESVLYGEVWEDASNKIAYGKRKRYYLGDELDGVMNYPLRKGLIEFFTNFNADTLRYALTEIINNAPKRIADLQMNLLGTHDTERILTVLGDEKSDGYTNRELATKRLTAEHRKIAIDRLKMAYTILATLPGIPSIYYGDEAGLEGYSDPFNRMTYPWGSECIDLIEHYKSIGSIRRGFDVYKEGAYSLLFLDSNLLIFKREDDCYSYITVVNNSSSNLTLSFNFFSRKLVSKKGKRANSIDELHAFSAEIYRVKQGGELTFSY